MGLTWLRIYTFGYGLHIHSPTGLVEETLCLHFHHISAVNAAIMVSIVITPIDSNKIGTIINDVSSINNESEYS